MARAADEAVFDDIVSVVNDFKTYFLSHGEPVSENPSPGNIEGGVTTLEEKSLGAVQKAGRGQVTQVLRYGQQSDRHGVVLLEAPGNDAVSSTALTAAGATVILLYNGTQHRWASRPRRSSSPPTRASPSASRTGSISTPAASPPARASTRRPRACWPWCSLPRPANPPAPKTMGSARSPSGNAASPFERPAQRRRDGIAAGRCAAPGLRPQSDPRIGVVHFGPGASPSRAPGRSISTACWRVIRAWRSARCRCAATRCARR